MTPHSDHRAFQLVVEQTAPDSCDLHIEQTNGVPENTMVVARIASDRLAELDRSVRVALIASDQNPKAVTPRRKKPIPLIEPAGVRLALAATSTHQIRSKRRRREILEGIDAMSDEETFYWFSKTRRPHSGTRALRALRLLLAEE